MNKFIISLVALSLSFGLVASAQMPGNGQKVKANLGTAYPKLATSSEAMKEALGKVRVEREAFQVRMEAVRSEVKTKIDQEKADLKVRLQVIKDEAKKAAAQKLDENMNNLNANFTAKFTKSLTDFDTYLSRLVDKASATSTTTASVAAKDTTAFNAAVESAKAAIVSARTAVEAQANKVYSITVSTEANLKSDVSSVRNTLNTDLKSVRDLVQAAHSATVKVLNEFNKIKINK